LRRARRGRARFAAIAVTAALGLACAQRGAPPGGPIDRDAPRVVTMLPADGATRLAAVDTVRLWFSERVDHKSVERAVRVFPKVEPLRFSWSENALAIALPPGAPAGASGERIVTLLSSATDRRGNRLAETFEAAFSQRDSIPAGVIEGTLTGVTGRGVARVLLFASPGPPADSLASAVPLRETAPEASGSFRIAHLPEGDATFAIFALLKESSGESIDPERDRVAFGPDSIRAGAPADSAAPAGLALKLVALDDPGEIRGLVDGGGDGRAVRLAALDDSTNSRETAPDSAGVFVLDSVPAGSYRLFVRDTTTDTEEAFTPAPGTIRVRPGERLVFGEPPRVTALEDSAAHADSTAAPDSSGANPADTTITPAVPLDAPEPPR